MYTETLRLGLNKESTYAMKSLVYEGMCPEGS